MPPEVRTGIYGTAVGILGVIASVQAKDGNWVAATLLLVTAGTSLMSAILTWRQRKWRVSEES